MAIPDIGAIAIEELVLRQVKLNMVYTFTYSGILEIEDTKMRLYNDTAADRIIKSVRVSVGTPAEFSPYQDDWVGIYIDVLKNGVSIFDETRGDIPETGAKPRAYIAPDEYMGLRENIDVVWAEGEYLTVSIDEVGDLFSGEDLTINVVVEE